jgi:hypothetical protein
VVFALLRKEVICESKYECDHRVLEVGAIVIEQELVPKPLNLSLGLASRTAPSTAAAMMTTASSSPRSSVMQMQPPMGDLLPSYHAGDSGMGQGQMSEKGGDWSRGL